MANRTTMGLEGAAELEAALRELPFRVAKNVLRRSLRLAAVPMVEAGQRLAPKPFLKARMSQSDRLGKNQRKVVGPQRRAKFGTYTVTHYVGQRPHQLAHLFEFGSSPRYTTGNGDGRSKKGQKSLAAGRGGGYRGTMPSTPFMRPAFDQTAPEVINNFGRILGKEIERAAVRLAKRKAKKASAAALSAR